MEKQRSGKRGTDSEKVQNNNNVVDCELVSVRGDTQGTHNNNNSSNNSAQINNTVNPEEAKDDDDNNSHPLVSTVVTRRGFRSSTIAKRACVSTINTRNSSLHNNNKSDRFSSSLNDITQRVTRRSSTNNNNNNNSKVVLEQIPKGDGNISGNEEALKSVIKIETEGGGGEEEEEEEGGRIINNVVSDEIQKQEVESPLNDPLKNPSAIYKQNSSSVINNALEKEGEGVREHDINIDDKHESTDKNHLDSVVVKIDPDQLKEQEEEEEEENDEEGVKQDNNSSMKATALKSSNNSPIKREKSTPCSSPLVSEAIQAAIGACTSPSTTTEPRSNKSSSKKGRTTSSNNNNNNCNPPPKKNNGNGASTEQTRVTPTNSFMNNLPYMGELTFDSRPRRGRKPKKADICHLISKNYGIQFPNSYVNIPSSSPTPCLPPPITVNPVTSGHISSNKSTKNKSTTLAARNSRNSSTTNNNSCNNSSPSSSSKHSNTLNVTSSNSSNNNNNNNNHSHSMKMNVNNINDNTQTNLNNLLNPSFLPPIPISWNNQLPPDLLPLASLNPVAFLHLKNSMNKKISLLPPPLHFHPQLQQQQQQNQDQLLQQQISRAVHDRFSPASDEPLNLCVKDQRDSSRLSHVKNLNSLLSTPIPRSSGNSSSSGSGKNHVSLSSIYHQGKSQGNSTKRGGTSHLHHNNNDNNSGSVTSNKIKNIVNEDPNLVNINLQLNLSASTLANYVNSSINNRPLTSLGAINNGNNFSNNISYNLNSPELNNNNNNNSNNSKVLGKSSKSRRKRAIYSPLMPGKSSNSTATSTGNSSGSQNSHNYPNSNHGHNNPHPSLYNSSLGSSMNPMDSSNSPFASASNPAEVSICKFKFTGGAKPSLQEKKMLSVDSTGNFRFYSDKPCTSTSSKNNSNNKNSNNLHPGVIKEEYSQSGGELVSAHGLPKSAKSMSMCMPVPIPAISTCSMVPDIPPEKILPLPYVLSPATVSADMDCSSSSDGGHSSLLASPTGESSSHSHPYSSLHDDMGSISNRMKRKRRTRKSLMREKLEKTFKEKGFLIQTQQVESSEGATYCKFRQLRKFTRYLFRSWKDYLPENLKGVNQAQNGQIDPSALTGLAPSTLSESMDIHDNGHESDAGTGSETPDNLTLSPEHTSQYDEQDPLEYEEDEDIDET